MSTSTLSPLECLREALKPGTLTVLDDAPSLGRSLVTLGVADLFAKGAASEGAPEDVPGSVAVCYQWEPFDGNHAPARLAAQAAPEGGPIKFVNLARGLGLHSISDPTWIGQLCNVPYSPLDLLILDPLPIAGAAADHIGNFRIEFEQVFMRWVQDQAFPVLAIMPRGLKPAIQRSIRGAASVVYRFEMDPGRDRVVTMTPTKGEGAEAPTLRYRFRPGSPPSIEWLED